MHRKIPGDIATDGGDLGSSQGEGHGDILSVLVHPTCPGALYKRHQQAYKARQL